MKKAVYIVLALVTFCALIYSLALWDNGDISLFRLVLRSVIGSLVFYKSLKNGIDE